MTDQTPPPMAPPPARMRRGLRWLLVASLALNLLFLGLAAGGAVRVWRGPPQAEAQPGSALMLLWRALPEEERRGLRSGDRVRMSGGDRESGQETQREAGRDSGPDDRRNARRESREAWRAALVTEVETLRGLLIAEPFDRTALEARLTEARDRQAARSEVTLSRMLDRIEAMSPAQRAEMVRRLEQRHLRRSDRPVQD